MVTEPSDRAHKGAVYYIFWAGIRLPSGELAWPPGMVPAITPTSGQMPHGSPGTAVTLGSGKWS